MRGVLLALLIIAITAPAFADDRSTYMAPLKRTGRSVGNTLDQWTGEAQDYVGVAPENTDSFMCSDPGFFVIKQESQIRDSTVWILKGVLHVPAAGYAYQFKVLGARGPEFFTQLQVGQPITPQYRAQNPSSPLQVVQKLQIPNGVGLLHIMVSGGSRGSQEIRCDITSVKPEPQE